MMMANNVIPKDGGLIIFWNALTGSELTRLTAHEESWLCLLLIYYSIP